MGGGTGHGLRTTDHASSPCLRAGGGTDPGPRTPPFSPASGRAGERTPNPEPRTPLLSSRRRFAIPLAFAAIYLIWGSTYLGIRFAIETVPPFLMAAVRNGVAGVLLCLWAWRQGANPPTRAHWRTTAVVGGLLMLGGNGSVVWAEQHVPSGLTALLVAIVPLWMVLFEWLRPGGHRPRPLVFAGLALGLAGMVLLVGPERLAGGGHVDRLGAAVLMLGTFSWALGSIYSRHADMPASPLLAAGMESLSGGVMLALAGAASGEWAAFELARVSSRSALALAYLVVFGSLVAFPAFIWLLRATTPARVSTYAYVNPVVAMALGWALAGEPLTLRSALSALVILSAVVVITRTGAAAPPSSASPDEKA
ncbi:MAG: EamA family transporter [Acidobacteriota bacterium]